MADITDSMKILGKFPMNQPKPDFTELRYEMSQLKDSIITLTQVIVELKETIKEMK